MAPKYSYKAKDIFGNENRGVIEAEDENGAISIIRSKDLYIIDIKQKRTELSLEDIKGVFEKSISSRNLMIFCRQFATMMRSGVTVLDALLALADQSDNPKLSVGLENVAEELRSGNSLSESFSKQSKVFPNLFINMISAGEEAGALDDVLERMAIHYEKEHQLQEKIKSAMMYPVILMGVAAVVLYILITRVLPQFAQTFTNTDVELPLPTELVLGFGSLIGEFGWLIFLALLILVAAVYLWIKSNSGSYLFDRVKLKTPLLGGVVQKVVIARFSRTLSTLIGSGVSLTESLALVKSTANNKIVEEVIDNAVLNLEQGQAMKDPFEESSVFPPLVVKMISVGEETGDMEEMLKKVAEFYEQESEHTLDRLGTIIEPVMILIMMVIVGFIVLSVVLPMVEMWQVF